MEKRIDKTVFVGVSGGVDSAVALAVLKDQGYRVVGVFIINLTTQFIDCTWQSERRDAMRVCAHLGVPFLECDAEKEYKKGVADYMIEEYRKGNTPNPDVMCNREVKFGVFWNFAKNHGADFIATGHYAQLLRSQSSPQSSLTPFLGLPRNGTPPPVAFQGLCELRKGTDNSKDQSYFLWKLNQEDLSHTLFPVGHLDKTKVRKIAQKYKLPNAVKKDSQGICFLGKLDMKDFLRHYIDTQKGDVLNEKGEIVGNHEGSVFFTIGERHGFNLNQNRNNKKPHYVISKDIHKNTITVSEISPITNFIKNNKIDNTILCEKTNWISIPPENNKKYSAQIRYHGEFFDCQVKILDKNEAQIVFKKNIPVDKGQSIVIYDGDVCIGGGEVK